MNEIRAKRGPRPLVSIIVLNYNSGPLLLECVESVRRYSKDYELIVVDNASSDGSLEGVRADILIRSSRNLGFAGGNNVGLRHAKGWFVVLLNSDTRVTEGWLESLLAEFQDPRVGLVQPKLVRFDGLLDSTGHRWDHRWQGPRVYDRGEGELDSGQYDMARDLKSCCFACVMIRRQVIDRLGPLDENYFLFYEDVDYSLMALNDGWRVRYCPEAKAYHHRGVSYRASGTQRKRLESQNSPYMTRIILKNYPLREALSYALREPLIVLVMIVKGLKNRDLAYVSKCARVLYWNLRRLPVRERVRLSNLKILDSVAATISPPP